MTLMPGEAEGALLPNDAVAPSRTTPPPTVAPRSCWDYATPMSSGLSAINRALNLIPKRAESRQAERLRDTFVDSGVAAALEAIDHQVLYGRRGTD